MPLEGEGELVGNVGRVDLTAPYLDSARDLLREKIHQAETSPRIDVHLRSTLTDLQGFVGNFTATVEDIWNIARQTGPDGIFVDGERAERARLGDGSTLQIGRGGTTFAVSAACFLSPISGSGGPIRYP